MSDWKPSSYGYGDHVGYLPGINDTIICPYNTAHVVGVSRMHRHLNNCREKNPDKAALISFCPYNQSHHIPTADMSSHLVICRDYLAHKFQSLLRRDFTERTGQVDQGVQQQEEKKEEVTLPPPRAQSSFRPPSSFRSPSSIDGRTGELPYRHEPEDLEPSGYTSATPSEFEFETMSPGSPRFDDRGLRSYRSEGLNSGFATPTNRYGRDEFFDNPPELPVRGPIGGAGSRGVCADTSRTRTLPPRVTKTCVVKKEMRNGELWTTFEGEGYPLAYPRDHKDKKRVVVPDHPKVELPPCDQEEIDNWTC